jgi:hypothetical protein
MKPCGNDRMHLSEGSLDSTAVDDSNFVVILEYRYPIGGWNARVGIPRGDLCFDRGVEAVENSVGFDHKSDNV